MNYFSILAIFLSLTFASTSFSQSSKTQDKSVPADSSQEEAARTTPAKTQEVPPTAADAKSPRPYNHSGFVAYFGPIFFKETFAVASEVINSSSTAKGFSAGFSIEYQMKYASFNFDFGIVGGYYSLSTTDLSYSSSGITLGGMLKPSLLFRLGPVEVGPIFPLLFRYSSFKRPPTGTLGTENFVPYFAAGGIVKYDFGQTRLAVHYSRISLDNPIAALELQFEL